MQDAENKATDYERIDQENKTVLTEQHLSQVAPVSKFLSAAGGSTSEGCQRKNWSVSKPPFKYRAVGARDDSNCCSHCGGVGHKPNQCFYKLYGWTCRACNVAGHKARFCRSAKTQQMPKPQRQQKNIEVEGDSDGKIQTVKGVDLERISNSENEFGEDVRLNGVPVRMELYTGSKASFALVSV